MSKSSFSLISFRFGERKYLPSGFPLSGGVITTADDVGRFGGVRCISRRREACGRSDTSISSSPQMTLKSNLFIKSLSWQENSEASGDVFWQQKTDISPKEEQTISVPFDERLFV